MIMSDAHISIPEYESLAPAFHSGQLDAKAWVAAAKRGGMTYVVFTAKHHDGFAVADEGDAIQVFDATPLHRDPLRE